MCAQFIVMLFFDLGVMLVLVVHASSCLLDLFLGRATLHVHICHRHLLDSLRLKTDISKSNTYYSVSNLFDNGSTLINL